MKSPVGFWENMGFQEAKNRKEKKRKRVLDGMGHGVLGRIICDLFKGRKKNEIEHLPESKGERFFTRLPDFGGG
jgi:hypothetical protein